MNNISRHVVSVLFVVNFSSVAFAQTNKILWYPPKGIEMPAAIKAELSEGAAKLGAEIGALRASLRGNPSLLALLPDIQIFQNAVRYALEDGIFYKSNEFASARTLLAEGHARAGNLREGRAPWTTATGNVVRGFVSKLDGSVQPYGLVVPAEFKPNDGKKRRLDIWFHGRGDNQSEVNFLMGRSGPNAKSEFMPADSFVLHPYGRFMNAFHGAGEVDVFEALADAKAHYGIDESRIAARGFSMAGAGAWHFGSHFAGDFFAVNPGAGFADISRFVNVPSWNPQPKWWETTLWTIYDPTNYAENFFNTTLVAYSGDEDKQKLAADIMEAALAEKGMKLTHIIGPKTGHKYEPGARDQVAKLVDAAAVKGTDPMPEKVRFVLFTLRYNRMKWVTVDALEQHWIRSTVEAELKDGTANVTTKGITGLTLELPKVTRVVLDGTEFKDALSFMKRDGKWTAGTAAAGLAKRHGMQGPIDDAFMEPFIFVAPSGTALNPAVDAWVKDEWAYATTQWRWQHRGSPILKRDVEITDADIAGNNLILFGDTKSNRLLSRLSDQLPVKWDVKNVTVGGKSWPSEQHVAVFIYPNPLNPKRYIVVNSGFTYAVMGGGNNSLQVPKLPDWAVVEMKEPRESRNGHGITEANFFDEHWQVR